MLQSLAKSLTNSAQDRYGQFLATVCIWQHVKMLKRSGCSHDDAGNEATQPGECTVECPACPLPEKNLPVGWENVPAPAQ